MPRRFYSAKKEKKAKKRTKLLLEEFSQKIEKLPPKVKAMTFLGIFIYCLLLGGLLATILNTSIVGFLLKFGR